MKKLSLSLFILYHCISFAQTKMKTFYESNQEIKQVHEEYEYIIVNDLIVKNGQFTAYDQFGDYLQIGNYSHDKKTGEWFFYTNNKLDSSGSYLNDMPDGKWKYYTAFERLTKEGTFRAGVRVGKWDFYNSSGNKSYTYNYLPERTAIEVYNENSTTTIIGESIENGILNGTFYYYYPDGQLRCKVVYKNSAFTDSIKSYYKNGYKLCVAIYDSSSIKEKTVFNTDGKINYEIQQLKDAVFLYRYYYPNGNKEYEIEKNDSVFHSYSAWDLSGRPLDCGNYKDGNGKSIQYNLGIKDFEANYSNYKLDGEYITYFSNGNIKNKQFYKNGAKVGIWEYYLENGKLQASKDIATGIITNYSKDRYDESVAKTLNSKAEEDIRPSYPGGVVNLMKYLSKNIIYPTIAKENGLEGKVIAKFMVNQIGSITNIEILKDGVGGGCAEEALRIVRSMPKWKPGYDNSGSKVKVYYIIPITFKLQ